MKEISTKELQKLLDENKDINMVDVREVDEVAEAKIPDSVNIPLGLLEFRMHELDKSKEYIMICRSGGRSGRAAQYLESKGFNVINMVGGMLAWEGETE
ncbi:rhodanese-like domain-containing protein [Aquibacillus rhizosphaerae]|uniref:Rhodanese-like domain-containing protein n=1 Tax=Aquibacillus rhizosphaerae TaxID=3051431 RepID=A0ABT7L3A6_9BACI|nr:rhodanese-like domain-containing protein [Aquibacillus sp. LR5S19]MDL4839692.1 rhodanese-like domain-containing protein [Aquibacillus sp. LR5S19]